MPRLTISLSEGRYQALAEAAARLNKSIVALIEESIEHYGIKTMETAAASAARSRRTADLDEDEAGAVAVEETRRTRD